MASEWYLRSGSTVTGPLTTDQLKAMGQSGRVVDGMEVAKSQSGPWHRAASVSGLVVIPAPPTQAVAKPKAQPKPTTIVVESPKVKHVTTEATRKFIKVQRLIALMVMFAGIGLMGLGMSFPPEQNLERATIALPGMALLFFGMLWRLILRVLHWWHHA